MKRDILRVFCTNSTKLLVAFFAAFLLPSILDIEGYANVKLYQLYVSYIGLLHLGYCDGIYLKYGGMELEENEHSVRKDVFIFVCFQSLIALSIIIFGIFKKDWIVALFGLTIFPRNARCLFEYIYQATGNFDKYAKIVNGYSIVTILFYFCCIFILKIENYRFYILMYCAIDVVIAVWSFALFKCNQKNTDSICKFECYTLKKNIQLGFFLMLGNFANTFFLNIDKWFVKYCMGMKMFAYYSFAAQILMMISMFSTPVTMTLYTYFSRKKDQNFEKEVAGHLLPIVFLPLCFPFVIDMSVNKFLSTYSESIGVSYILFVSQLMLALNSALFINLFKVYKKQRLYFRNLCIMLIVSVLLNFIFYKLYNRMISFAFATMITSFLMLVVNGKEFAYLTLKNKDKVFVCLMLALYFILHMVCDAMLGFVLYLVLYFVSFFLLEKRSASVP